MTITSSLPLPPGDGERFSDPAANPVYAAICSLDVASQHDVLRLLREKLYAEDISSESGEATRRARAITALNEARAELGKSPSVDEYRRLYGERRAAGIWPDDRCVRRWLGAKSWNGALRRAHLEPVPDGDVTVFQHGPHYSLEEALEAVRECTAELGHPPTWPEYLAWVNHPEVRARVGRRPRSYGVLTRLAGTWPNTLRAAGVIPGDPDHGVVTRLGLRRAEYRVSDENLQEGIREVATRLGRSPRVQEYMRERERIYEETLAAGAPRAIPSYGTLNRRFGGEWDELLIWAGLEPLGGRATGRRVPKGAKGPRATEEIIGEALREAYAELGDPFTVAAYMQWRREKRGQLPPWERGRYPAYHTIWSRHGTWEAACRAALGEHQEG